MTSGKNTPKEHKKQMIKDYLGGATAKEAASKFGYSYMACFLALRQYGIQSRGRSEAHRKYAVNENYFDRIDTEEKAYWLGFLSADGTILPQYILLRLAVKDKEHVYKFAHALESEHPITVRDAKACGKTYKFVGIRIGSSKLAKSLIQLGVTPNKSLTISPCDKISLELMRHYWRGVFDGDGSISFSYNKGGGSLRCNLSLTCSKAMIYGFRDFVLEFVKFKTKPYPDKNVYSITFGGVPLPQKIIRLLYAESHVYLERKKKLAGKLLALPIQRVNRSNVTQEDLENLYDKFGTWKKVANHMGTATSVLWRIRKCMGLLQ